MVKDGILEAWVPSSRVWVSRMNTVVQGNSGADGEIDGTPDGKRPVSLFSATVLVIANMVGTGVFTSLGLQVANVPSGFSLLLLWAVGGLMALLGALSYAELGAMMPRSGGEYTYLSRIYHPAVGFLSGWVSFVAGFAAPVALTAIALSQYLGDALPWVNKTAVSVSVVVALSVVHMIDVRFGCYFQNFFTVAKVLMILALIAAGCLVSNPQEIALVPSRTDLGLIFSPAFAVSLVYVSYAYSGWNASAYIAGEIRQPEKRLPLSLLVGTLGVSFLYVMLNFIFLRTVPISELRGKIEVGYLSADHIWGSDGSRLMAVLISLALVSTISSMVMTGPRVVQTMGEDIAPLRLLARRNRRGAPAFAILFQSLISILLIMTSSFDVVLTYVGFTLSLFASMTVLGVFVLRIRNPQAKRPFRAWGYPATPALFLILNGCMQCYLILNRPLPSLVGLATVGCGWLLFRFFAPGGRARERDESKPPGNRS